MSHMGAPVRRSGDVWLRIREALGLTWGDVNLEARSLVVQRGLVWVDGEFSIGPLKTTAAHRTISLPDSALVAFKAIAPAERDSETPVFRSIHGNPPRHDQLHQPLARLCREASV